MKKNSIRASLANFSVRFSIALIFCGTSSVSNATLEIDRLYALDSVGLLRSYDNMDGLFADYVASAYKDYFLVQSRFVLQDLTKADAVLTNSKLSYVKIIDDPKLLAVIAKTNRSGTLIRTKIVKEGPSYRFSIDWLHAPSMEILSSVNFVMEEPTDGHRLGMVEIRDYLQKAIDRLISKVPFKGQVTGRDHDSVTLNIGLNLGLRKGDEVVVGTIDDVKKHPLLHSIVDWRITKVGRLSVDSVDEGMAFTHVVEEDPAKKINQYQKVMEFFTPKPEKSAAPETVDLVNGGGADSTFDSSSDSNNADHPHLGWANVGLWFGLFSRENSSSSAAVPKAGGGLLVGTKPEAQVWLNKNWFADLGFFYGIASYAPDSASSTADTTSVSASVKGFRLGGGYNYYIDGDIMGPKAFAKLNYKSTQYDLGTSVPDGTSSISLNGLSIGVGGELPIREPYGVMVNLDLGVLTSASETGLDLGDALSASDAGFFLGGYYRNSPKTRIQAGIDFMSSSIDFPNNINVSHKVIAVTATYLFYF